MRRSRRRFRALWQKAGAGELSSWETSDDGALALGHRARPVPRNMFRGDAQDLFKRPRWRCEVARRAVERGVDQRVDQHLLEFLYMPFDAFGSICRPVALHASCFAQQPATPKT